MWLQPALLLGAELADLDRGAGAFGRALDLDQEVAERRHPGDRIFAELGAEALAELHGQAHPVERIEAEVELRAAVQGQGLGREALLEPVPDLAELGRIEQRAVAGGELLRRRGRAGARLGALEQRAELVPPQLADLGAGQGFGGDREVAEPLVGGEPARALLELGAQALAQRVGVFGLECCDLGHDQADQAAALVQDRELVDRRAVGVDRLDLVGEDVLAAGQDDQLLAAADDVQVALGVEAAEIARAEEAVAGEGLAGRLGIVPVAGEDVGAFGLDLARRRAAGTFLAAGTLLAGLAPRGLARVRLSLRASAPWPARGRQPAWCSPDRRSAGRRGVRLGRDPQLDPLDRQAGALEAGAAGRVEGQDRRGLGQAVAGQHLPAQALELPGDLGLEPGAARGEQAEIGPELAMERPEQAASGAPAEPAPELDRERQQAPVDLPDDVGAGVHPALDAVQHGLVEPWHADHDRASAVRQRVADLGPADPARQDHGGARRQAGQEPDGQRVGVVQRQRQEHAVGGSREPFPQQRVDVGGEIGVAERHPLGRAGGARGVDQDRLLVRLELGQAGRVVAQEPGPVVGVAGWLGGRSGSRGRPRRAIRSGKAGSRGRPR